MSDFDHLQMYVLKIFSIGKLMVSKCRFMPEMIIIRILNAELNHFTILCD
jgi:hypothetical protein